MSYSIKPVEEQECVYLTYEGELVLSERAAAGREIGDLLAAKRWHRMLVDVTATRTVLKAGELFDVGRALSRNLPRGARIALVVRPDQAKRAQLVETVARHGGTFLAFFVDAEKAVNWVEGDVLKREHSDEKRPPPATGGPKSGPHRDSERTRLGPGSGKR